MAAISRLQINFERLLNICEKDAFANDENNRWRLDKYVDELQVKLTQLNKESCNKAHPEILKDYRRRVDLLKGVLKAEKMNTTSDKVQTAQKLPIPKTPPMLSSEAYKPSQSKEILLHTKAKFSNESRRALLGDKGDGLRQRGGTAIQPESDLDAMIHYHQQMQEKLADDMVQLARNMKDHAHAAGKIVKDDTKKLQDASKLADTNYTQLKIESNRLEEQTKKSSWWMALLLLFVVLVFIWMIIFMKLFPKPKT